MCPSRDPSPREAAFATAILMSLGMTVGELQRCIERARDELPGRVRD